jgi:hypothetical protein
VIAGTGYNGFPQEPSCRDERPPETNENCPSILDLLSLSARIHAADRLKVETIKGRSYAVFRAANGNAVATYAP